MIRSVDRRSTAQAALALGALGVVFGDIGTSPLYTIQTVFSPSDPTQSRPAGRACSGSSH
jgi:KUP system potassium uptake protein